MDKLSQKNWLYKNSANIITMIGFAICPYLFWVIIFYPQNLALIFCLLTAVYLTDFIDGKVARALNVSSKFGGAIDRLRDKLCAAAVFTLLFMNNNFDFVRVEAVPVIIVEILLLTLLFIGLAKKVNVSANIFGKLRMFSFSIITSLCFAIALLDEYCQQKLLSSMHIFFKVMFVVILVFAIGSLTVHWKNFRLQLQTKNSVNR